jgi:hypothetical protein
MRSSRYRPESVIFTRHVGRVVDTTVLARRLLGVSTLSAPTMVESSVALTRHCGCAGEECGFWTFSVAIAVKPPQMPTRCMHSGDGSARCRPKKRLQGNLVFSRQNGHSQSRSKEETIIHT